MELSINLSNLEGRQLLLVAGSWSKPKLKLDGAVVTPLKSGKYLLKDNNGKEVELTLQRTFSSMLDGVPEIEVDRVRLRLIPPLAVFEYVWSALPIVLLFIGGAIGGGLGYIGTLLNVRIFRKPWHVAAKYAVTGLITLAAAFIWFVAVTIIHVALRKP